MMHFDSDRLAVGAVALLGTVVHVVRGSRASRFVVAPILLVIAVLVVVGIVAPVVAYGLLCLALASAYLFGQERARGLRVASLAPRPAVEVIPGIWIGCAAASVVLLVPYVALAQERAAALLIGACTLLMAAIAWRVASAPEHLAGEDIRAERMCDRAFRSKRVGLSAVIAIGNVFVFLSFVNAELAVVTPIQLYFHRISFVAWIALLAWQVLYVSHLERVSRLASS